MVVSEDVERDFSPAYAAFGRVKRGDIHSLRTQIEEPLLGFGLGTVFEMRKLNSLVWQWMLWRADSKNNVLKPVQNRRIAQETEISIMSNALNIDTLFPATQRGFAKSGQLTKRTARHLMFLAQQSDFARI